MTNNNITFTAPWGATLTMTPRLGQYSNGRLAISFDCEDGPWGHLTINLPDQHLNEGEVFIKDWSENEGLPEVLIEAGWLIWTGREVSSGYVFPKVMRPAGPLLDLIKWTHCSPGQKCGDMNTLCTKHQSQYQNRWGRASNE